MSARPENSRRGRLIVIAAPSGAGKTTLVHALLERVPGLEFSVSYTTRAPRETERPGVDYFFVAEAEFRRMIEADAFLEYARVFDHWYGTGREHVDALLDAGRTVILEIDWQGARQVRARAPEAVSVFVMPPSVAELERRLRGRKTDSEATIRRRLDDALGDMSHWREFDYVLINEDVAAAADELAAIVLGKSGGHETRSAPVQARMAAILGA